MENIPVIIFILSMSWLSAHGVQSAPTYDYHICMNETFSPHDGTYEANLIRLLFTIATVATIDKKSFFNLSVSSNDEQGLSVHHQQSPITTLYGLYLCRGDIQEDTCTACVSYAVEDIVVRCPRVKEAYIWYDECSLRYSDTNIFGSDQEDPQLYFYNVNNISEPNQLAAFLGTTMAGEMANQAASDASGKKFVTRQVKLTALDTLYSMVQCTPDLPPADCIRCIQTGVSNIPSDKVGARVLLPSCSVRYETYPFYNYSTVLATPRTPSDKPTARTTSKAPGKKNSSARVIVSISVPVSLVALLLAAGMTLLLTNKRPLKRPHAVVTDIEIFSQEFNNTAESFQYDLNLLQAATNNFLDANKLGEGGFGAVYRGSLPNGREIAVKRLSQRSSQGVPEFKNEVTLVAKLQHRNLVKLLGFCVAGDEKLLVYEFVPNKSLDYFLFDSEKQTELNWARRYKIIKGIARGILYLHEDSRLRIIHRDIKASNILLDADMTPKISDFGLAKILGLDESRGNTERVAGTYGYMAPEYAFTGEFSESSDVYSFGILVLEIISGHKINKFRQSEYPEHLMCYAWKRWKENKPLEIMDPSLRGSEDSDREAIRCIHLGLLCVQEDVNARPSMSTVVMLLNYHSVVLPQPQNPAFYSRSNPDILFENIKQSPSSVNLVEISEVGPR